MADRKFNPVEEWDEEDGDCLFFKLDAGEPPTVTSPLDSDWEDGYFTHFMRLPQELRGIDDYVKACRESGIVSELDRSAESGKSWEVGGVSRADLEQIERGLDEWLQQHKIDDRYGYNGASWQEPCTLNLMPGSAKALLDFIRAGLYQ